MPGSGYSVFNLAGNGVADITFNAAGTLLFASTTNGQVNVYDVASHALLHTWTIGNQLGGISLSEDGAWLLATERNVGASGTSILYRINAATGAFTAFTRPGTAFNDVEAVTNGLALVTGASGGITTFNIATGAFGSINGFSGAQTLTESGRYTLMGDAGLSPGSFAVYNDVTNLVSPAPFNSSGGDSWGVQAISERLGRIALFNYYSRIAITDLSFQLVTSITANGPIIGMNFSADGQFFYYYQVNDGTVVKKETVGWTTVETLSVDPGSWNNNWHTGSELIISENGHYMAVRDSSTGDLNLVDLTQRNESFAGTAGTDNLAGGPGDDIYFVNLPSDIVTENPFEGNDTVYSTANSYTLSANVERLILDIGAVNGTGSPQANVLIGNDVANYLSGEDGNDILLGDAGSDLLYGGSGEDILNGGDGADIMAGGTANDIYIVDTIDDLIFDYAGEGNDAVYTSGNYTLRTGIAIETLLTDAPTATSAINLSGNEFGNAITGNAGANILLGNGGDDALIGLGGDDNLDGGAGLDITNGGQGDDVHIVDNASDIVIEAAGEGRDLVYASASFSLRTGDSVELLLTTNQAGTGAINLSGNEISNIVQGNDGANIMFGGAGADVLLGFGGDDFLNGGTGADIMTGGTGDDIYFTDSIDDIILENAGEGRDILYSTSNYVLRGGVSVEYLLADPQSSTAAINLTGNEIANNIQGNAGVNILFGGDGDDLILGFAGNDTINGNSGNDMMIGGTGDDIFFVDSTGDVVSEAFGQGRDFVYTTVNFVLGINDSIEVLIADSATGSAPINLTGNVFANTIHGNAGNNILLGGFGDDVIIGNGGNDTIDGGSNNDSMAGGTGDDVYFVDSASDVVTELAGEGRDVVYAASSFTLASNSEVEELIAAPVAGNELFSLTGSDIANIIRGDFAGNLLSGGGGDDVLFGLAGFDTLRGGTGNDNMAGGTEDDIYYVDSAADVVIEAAGEGSDRIFASVNYVLAAGVYVETLSADPQASTTPINLTGNEIANEIQGNAGANVLTGGGGNDVLVGLGGNDTLRGDTGIDTMLGGMGDDIYWVNDAGDIADELYDQGNDLIVAFVDYVLPVNSSIELLYGDGASFLPLNLTGNFLANNIQGTQGFNILYGADGDDVIAALSGDDQIDGGRGSDRMTGGLGADTFFFRDELSATNVDTIVDFASGLDRIGLSASRFGGLPTGALASSAFVVGTAALDADDRIIYNSATGALFFDADGNGAGAAVQFATLTGNPIITASDFIIV